MSKRFFTVSLIVIGLVCSSFTLVVNSNESLISVSEEDFSLIEYKEKASIDEEHKIILRCDKKSFSEKDIDYRLIGGSYDIKEFNRCIDLSYKTVDNDIVFTGKVKAYGVYSVDVVPIVDSLSLANYAWWSSAWSYKINITINHSQIPSTLYNFPVLINISDNSDMYDKVQPDFDDILFTDDTECVQLNHEIEHYLSGGSVVDLVAWVNVTEISHTVDTKIVMYFGNDACANQEHITDTWDSNYYLVYHFSDIGSTDTLLDSTVYNHDASEDVSHALEDIDYRKSSPVGYGVLYDNGENHDIPVILSNADWEDGFTIENWLTIPNVQYTIPFVFQDSQRTIYDLADVTGTRYNRFYTTDDGTVNDLLVGSAFSFGVWTHCFLTYDGTDKYIYDEGGTYTSTEASLQDKAETNDIGAYTNDGSGMDGGVYTEFRISNIARSENWLVTCYNTINNATDGDANCFFTLDSRKTNNLPTAVPVNIANGSIDVPVSTTHWNSSIIDDWTNFNYTIQCSNGDTVNVNNASNGIKSLSLVSGLICETNYTVWVNITEWNWCTSDEGRTVYYWFWFVTEDCEPVDLDEVFFEVLTSNITSCPCCISLCYNINGTGVFNVTLNSNYTDSWKELQSFNLLSNGSYCFVIYNWTRYNYTYYFNYTFDNGANFSYTGYYYVITDILSNCSNILGDSMEINIEISQLVMLMLLGCWLFFTAKYYEKKEIILAWVQFCFAMPLSFIIGGLVASYTLGYAVAIIIPLLSLVILADVYYRK